MTAWHVALCQAVGARPVHLALGHSRRRFDLFGATRLHAGWDRLEKSPTHGGLWQQAELWSTILDALRHTGASRIAWFVILLLCGDGIGPTARRCIRTEGGIDRSTRQALRRRSADRASAVGNRQNEAGDVRPALRAHSAAYRSVGIAA